MKTLFPISTAVVILFASVQAANAAPYGVSHVDEHAVAGVAQARQIRAAIASRFSVSRDQRDLLRDADQLVASMNAVHDAVHSHRSRSTMRSLVNNAQRQLRDLDRRVGRSDYTYSTPGFRQTTATGYISFPASQHPGHIHVGSVQRMLDQLGDNLNELESDLEPTFHYAPAPYPVSYGPGYGW